MRKRVVVFAALALVGCVKGTPMEPEWFCTAADTVVVGAAWTEPVRACIAAPQIQTQVRR